MPPRKAGVIPTLIGEVRLAQNSAGRCFTPYHLARDLYANLVPFTFYILRRAIGHNVSFQGRRGRSVAVRFRGGPSGTVIVFLPALVLLGSFCGIIVERVFMGPWRLVVSRRPEALGYGFRYREDKTRIAEIHSRYFGADEVLAFHSYHSDRVVDQLLWPARRLDPDGFYSVYRHYALLSMCRVSIVYTLAVLAFLPWVDIPLGAVVCLLLLLLVTLASAYATALDDATNSEFNLITAVNALVGGPRRQRLVAFLPNSAAMAEEPSAP